MAAGAVRAIVLPATETARTAEKEVALPPMLVVASRLDWVHGEAPGFEVLSCCSKDATELFVQRISQCMAELASLVPEEFLLHASEPTLLILVPPAREQAMAAEMAKMMTSVAVSMNTAPHLRLTDVDSTAMYVVVDSAPREWLTGDSRGLGPRYLYFTLSPDFVRSLIQMRQPTVPDWCAVGLAGLFGSGDDQAPPPADGARLTRVIPGWYGPTNVPDADADRIASLAFNPDPWISRLDADVLRDNGDAPRPLLPMQELFAGRPAAGKSPDYQKVWEAQSELFVRWALSGKTPGGSAAFWRFARLATRQAVTEELFQSCFGLDYADARDALSDYLPEALRNRVPWPGPVSLPEPPELRAATQSEIDRIKGEWGRRVLRPVRSNCPDLLHFYVDQAKKALQGAFERGERDPRLVGTLGLLRLDTGEEAGARQALEEAVAAGATRPLVLVELARLRLKEYLQHPTAAPGNLGEDQAANIMSLIRKALAQQPPLRGAYSVAADVMSHLGRDPNPAERAMLDGGAQLYAADTALVLQAAKWDARAGDRDSAHRLIELGLWQSADPVIRGKLVALDQLLSAPAAGRR